MFIKKIKMKISLVPKVLKILLFNLFLISNVSAQEKKINIENFKYYADILGNIQNNKINSVYLNEDILNKSENDLKDIRVFNSNGSEVPFIIIDEKTPEDLKEIKNFEIIDYSEQDNKDIIISELKENNNEITPILDKISFEISDTDFNKKIKIYGSQNKSNWTFISENNIYDFSSKINLKKTQINLSKPVQYKFYKFEIQNLSQLEKDSMLKLNYKDLNLSLNEYDTNYFRINSINAETFSKNREIINYDSNHLKPVINNRNKKTIIELKNTLPINKIIFDISDPYFYREVSIYSEENKKDLNDKNTQNPIFKDYIYDIGSGENNEKKYMNLNYSNLKNLRIEISDSDNPPLIINKITTQRVKKNLFFLAGNDNKYSIYISNRDIESPVYDINNYINQYNWFKTKYSILKASEIKINQNFKKEFSKNDKEKLQKNILIALIFMVSALLAVWIYKMMKTINQ